VRHTGCAAQNVPDPVAGAFADPALRADHRHPRADLAIEPRSAVVRVGLDHRQAGAEQAQRVVGCSFGDWLAVYRADVLDSVIDRPDPGRQKQPLRGVNTRLRVEDNGSRHHQRMAKALLDVTLGVGTAGRAGKFPRR